MQFFFLSVEEEELTKPEIIADDEVAEEQPAPVLIETPAVFVPESIENTKVVEDIIIAKDLEVEQEVVPLPKDILELQTEQINAGEADNEEKNLIGKFQEESIIAAAVPQIDEKFEEEIEDVLLADICSTQPTVVVEKVEDNEPLIETKENILEKDELALEEVVEAEPRFQATPDDFEKEYTINVKEDQFNMSEAAPEPMENLVQEQQPEPVVLEQEVVMETKPEVSEIPQDLVPEEPKAEVVEIEPPKIQEEVPEPVEEIAKPVEETPEPVEETPKPVEEAPKPVEEISEPVLETPAFAEAVPKVEEVCGIFTKKIITIFNNFMIFYFFSARGSISRHWSLSVRNLSKYHRNKN